MDTVDPRDPLVLFVGLLAATLVLSGAILRVLAGFAGRSRALLALLFVPGVVVHELAHAAACVLTGTRIRRIVLWNGSGGCVEHARPRWAVLQPIISYAPVPVGLTVLACAGSQFTEGDWPRNAALLWVMVSVSATLAPSGEDARIALVGSFGLLLAGLALGWLAPGGWSRLRPAALTVTPHLLQVVAILVGILVVLKLVAGLGPARRRR